MTTAALRASVAESDLDVIWASFGRQAAPMSWMGPDEIDGFVIA